MGHRQEFYFLIYLNQINLSSFNIYLVSFFPLFVQFFICSFIYKRSVKKYWVSPKCQAPHLIDFLNPKMAISWHSPMCD